MINKFSGEDGIIPTRQTSVANRYVYVAVCVCVVDGHLSQTHHGHF